MVMQGTPYVDKLMTLLRLKGKTDVLVSLTKHKGKPCLVVIYFNLICESNIVRDYQLWMEPGWTLKTLYDKADNISRFWQGYINDSGIKEINNLEPKIETETI